jgi:hypothetical protein
MKYALVLGTLAVAILVSGAWFSMTASAGQDDLAQVRRATAQFKTVEAAEAAGYELGYAKGGGDRIITGCIAHPTDGAMGYHYFNDTLVNEVSLDPLKPEVLVYAPGPNAQLKLVAVEWVVPGELVDESVDDIPNVLGMDLHILVPAVDLYIQHAWIWKHNPAGMFEDWNPQVSCP